MKKMTLGLVLLSFASLTQAGDLKDLGKVLLGQATRQSSCTYRLTIEQVGQNKIQLVKRSSVTADEACAIAKTACGEIGSKKGFFGRHECEKMNEDGGGVITRTIEGDFPNSSSNDQSVEIEILNNKINQLNRTILDRDDLISHLRREMSQSAGSNIELELNDLRNELRKKNKEIANLNSMNTKLRKKLDSNSGTLDLSSVMAACSDALVTDESTTSCFKIGTNAAAIKACGDQIVTDDSIIECISIGAPAGIINQCGEAIVTDDDTNECIRGVMNR